MSIRKEKVKNIDKGRRRYKIKEGGILIQNGVFAKFLRLRNYPPLKNMFGVILDAKNKLWTDKYETEGNFFVFETKTKDGKVIKHRLNQSAVKEIIEIEGELRDISEK